MPKFQEVSRTLELETAGHVVELVIDKHHTPTEEGEPQSRVMLSLPEVFPRGESGCIEPFFRQLPELSLFGQKLTHTWGSQNWLLPNRMARMIVETREVPALIAEVEETLAALETTYQKRSWL